MRYKSYFKIHLDYIMEQIFEANSSFDFDAINLYNPVAKAGGSYFIKFGVNNTPLYIQPPKCGTKQGFVTANRKCFIDLMFSQDDLDFIQWLENLETFCHKQIYEHREQWFEGDLELSDIENYFTSPVKIFKSGKYYLVRCDIYNVLGKPQLQIFDEKEKQVEYDDITEDSLIMNILEIKGIKCSSKSFQIVIEIKQMMKMEKVDMFAKCLFKRHNTESVQSVQSVQPEKDEVIETTPLEKHEDDVQVKTTEEELSIEEPIGEFIKEPIEESIEDTDENTLEITTNTLENENVEMNDEIKQSEEEFINPPEEIIDETQQTAETAPLEQVDISINDEPLENVGLQEIDISCDNIPEGDEFEITERKDVYYKMYRDARKKAKLAKELSIASYLEAKNIKNSYMLDDIDSESEDDESLE